MCVMCGSLHCEGQGKGQFHENKTGKNNEINMKGKLYNCILTTTVYLRFVLVLS